MRQEAAVIDRHDITGLVLAGGRGSRMGGVDKGLQHYRGLPLVAHALQRLAPQVGQVMISANRNLADYAAFGVPVWSDANGAGQVAHSAEFAGPLAGMRSGLDHCPTPWLAVVPCDSPWLPTDWVAQLAAGAIAASTGLAVAATSQRLQPVVALLHVDLRVSLAAFLANGGRKIESWMIPERPAIVTFADATAFRGANTYAELQSLS